MRKLRFCLCLKCGFNIYAQKVWLSWHCSFFANYLFIVPIFYENDVRIHLKKARVDSFDLIGFYASFNLWGKCDQKEKFLRLTHNPFFFIKVKIYKEKERKSSWRRQNISLGYWWYVLVKLLSSTKLATFFETKFILPITIH
jgi:hypothetical protein